MTSPTNRNLDTPTLEELRIEGCKIADQISRAAALINLDYAAASGVLNDHLWPRCHGMPEGLAHDFLKLQLMNAKEDLADLTSPWGYRWGPDRDRLMETQDILEASRFLAALQDHLMVKFQDDAARAKDLRQHLAGIAALIDAVTGPSAAVKK